MPTWTAAVDVLMDGAMYNAGQCCCGIERIYVHESLYRQPSSKSPWPGSRPAETRQPLRRRHHPWPDGEQAVRRRSCATRPPRRSPQGAKPLIDPAQFPADDGGAYLAPQILVNVDHSMRVMKEESFGPVVGIMPVKDDAEAIALMND